MSYIINKTDGTVLTEVVDGTIDQTSSDLTLIGKNASSYGELFNENFVKLLENFANTSKPNYPITGQLWYDTSEARLKVYDGLGFKVSGGTIVSPTVPSTIAQGDIWIDSYRQQLYFNDGVSTVLVGPTYTTQQGISGFQSIDIIDTNSLNHTVVLLYVGQVLIGIFAKEEFTPASPIAGYTGDLKIGFNVGNYSGVKFNVPVSQADSLIAADGTLKTAASFVSSTDDSNMYGSLTLLNSTPLVLGVNQNNEIKVSTDAIQFNSNIINQDFKVNVISGSLGLIPAITVDAQNQRVGLFTTDLLPPQATLDVAGDVRVQGNLTVEGSTTTINTTNLAIQDLLIELGKVDTPTDVSAEGGGIKLLGDTDKTLTWAGDSSAWTSSEHFDIVAGKTYNINKSPVLTSDTVYSYYAPNLQSIGTLNSLQVDDININGTTISYFNNSFVDGNITIAPKGAGTVDVSNKRITSIYDRYVYSFDPVSTPLDGQDAANVNYVDYTVQKAPLGLSANITGIDNATIATTIIGLIYPPSEHYEGCICRLWGVDTGSAKQFGIVGGAWIHQADL